MKTEATETTSRDTDTGAPQLYRLVCTGRPGRKTGRRIAQRSAPAVVQKEEHAAGSVLPGPELPAGNREPVPTAPDSSICSTPAGSGNFGTGMLAGSVGPTAFMPKRSGNSLPGTPAGSQKPVTALPAEPAPLMPQTPAGTGSSSPEQAASDTTGGGGA